ncbi:MAG: toxin-antitoxin system, antitoxin component, Xre family protein [Lachnospiraceae bacterium]|nr:toxin-antitoxin system, antitoxin component, Xre family protein [Lachnospiraceae bacterium]
MINSSKLEDKIIQSGLKKKYIAEQLKISIQTLRQKIYNKNDFLVSEASALIEILNIEPEEANEIFFAKDVDN